MEDNVRGRKLNEHEIKKLDRFTIPFKPSTSATTKLTPPRSVDHLINII